MKKWIIYFIIVFLIAVFISQQGVNYINKPSTCADCHGSKHQDNSYLQRHSNRSIDCLDCHSGNSSSGYVTARKEVAYAIIFDRAKPLLDFVFNNTSYNITFIHLEANCTKCHQPNSTSEITRTGLLEKIEAGGHANKTCEDCHSTNFKIPRCTDCHKSHAQKSSWDNSACLACHNDPHIPVQNGIYSRSIPKENCGVCHEESIQTLTLYNSKHNQLGSCIDCHPVHKEKKSCLNCHIKGHDSHPFAQDNCNSCHFEVACSDCHKYPHAPLSGLSGITTQDQFNNYAAGKAH